MGPRAFPFRRAALCGAACLALAAPARAQDTSGAIDTRGDVEEQIRYLEQFVGGDMAAEKQVVTYRWLADLYVSVGQLDRAQRCYEQILVFFPNDVGAANAYAAFLLDHRRDPAAAEKVLADAVAWARSMESPPPYLGQTHVLRARAYHALGRDEDALRAADRALALLDADAAEDARRVQAQSLAALGRRGDAEDALLELIGLSGGSNADDITALIALMSDEGGRVDARKVDQRVEKAIAEARKERKKALEHEGAEMVTITAEDGVRIEATLRRGKEKGAILFVPDHGGRRAAYTPFAQLFALDGITTLTIDPRGHGDSRCDSLPSYEAMAEHHRERLAGDIAAAWAYLRDTLRVPAEKIVLVSEGAACATAEQALYQNKITPLVVHLSPVIDPDDREATSALEFRAPLATLVTASDEDAFAMRSMALYTDVYPAPTIETRTFNASGHGSFTLRKPENFAEVSNWIRKSLGLPR